MTKWRGIPTQCVIQMDYLNELMEEWLYRRDETLLLNVNPWSAAQLCNIYDQRQKKRFTAIADDSVWNSSPYRNWRFLKNVDDSKNLREVLATQYRPALLYRIVGTFDPGKQKGNERRMRSIHFKHACTI